MATWFETKTAEYDTALVAAGLRFAADDGEGGDVHFDATASCDAHTTVGVSTDTVGGASVDFFKGHLLRGVSTPYIFLLNRSLT